MSKRWDFSVFREDMRDPDPDKPHQAMFDLNQELEKPGFVLEEDLQRSVMQDVMRQALESCHSDVQGAAVKCIPCLVKKVKEKYIAECVAQLTDKLTASRKEHRDIATISLKYVVDNIPATYKDCLVSLAASLVRLLRTAQDDIKLDIMDVVTDLLRHFGAVLPNQHESLQTELIQAFTSSSPSVRKRAITCLGALSAHTSEVLFQSVIRHVVSGIEAEKGEMLRKHIQLCSVISRGAGHRLGASLERIVPLLMANLEEAKLDQIEDDGERNDVRENIMQAFESFVQRCPQQVTAFLPQMIEACKEGMSYDPYYDYDDDDQPDDDMVDDEDDEYQDMLEAEADDDDDVSWKVRKASAKCLSSIIQSRADSLHLVYAAVCSKEARDSDLGEDSPSKRKCLLERFKEREESVRLDILKAFSDLLKATQIPVSGESLVSGVGVSGSYSASFRMKVECRPEVRFLIQVKDFAVDSIIKATRDKSMKVKTTCFQLLKLMSSVLRSELEGSIAKFLALIKETLATKDATSALKTEVLQLLMMIISSCPSTSPEAQRIVPELLDEVLACVSDRYYKIMAESLRVCGELAPIVVKAPDAQQRTHQLFDAVFERLRTADVDQEVKDCAIATVANILKNSASKLQPQHYLTDEQVSKCFKQLLVLLGGDYSRVSVIRAVTVTRDVPMEPELLHKFVQEISMFLRKASRPLRQASLHCLRTLTERKARDIDPALLSQILQELLPLLNDSDLHLSHLAIDLADAVLRSAASVPASFESKVLPRFVDLLRSPLLQGSALESLENAFQNLGPKSKMGYHPLLQMVLAAASSTKDSRQVLPSVAAVAARLTSVASEDQQAKTVEQFSAYLNGTEAECALGLACLGELGRFVDLSQSPNVLASVQQKFSHSREDIKMLTAVALGKITSGNPEKLLPSLLATIEEQEDMRYLLFRALKETLARSDHNNEYDPMKRQYKAVLDVCMRHAASTDEGTRNVVSECLGKLAVLDSQAVTKRMFMSASDSGPTAHMTATVITAMKYAVSEPIFKYDSLTEDVKFFLSFMNKPEDADKETNAANVKVRRAAVQLFTAAVHSKPFTVRPSVAEHIKALLAQCVVDQELVRMVNLGPFVHKVDDGLELRKSAFECIDILLDGSLSGDSLLDYLNDYMVVAEHLTQGMAVAQGKDIQILNFIMFSKMCRIQRARVAVMTSLDVIFGQDMLPKNVATCVTQLGKESVVQQDKDKITDLLVTMLKMIRAIRKVPRTEEHKALEMFISSVVPTIPEHVRDRAVETKE
eukprot:TRINITY_DN34207_c0_g2_i1.p1 TRINITY_DN34207_c0_g2~~TRINITY_DN34207_c0_g2_i1.p1  ORF type:complete len:1278 (+),score=657.22 TRINITY_DN34207_c0_g2_i1:86-3919(+)